MNESVLNGEFEPIRKAVGDSVFSWQYKYRRCNYCLKLMPLVSKPPYLKLVIYKKSSHAINLSILNLLTDSPLVCVQSVNIGSAYLCDLDVRAARVYGVRLKQANRNSCTVNQVQYRNGNDETGIEPVCYINMTCFTNRESA